jgi:hypothetical protein
MVVAGLVFLVRAAVADRGWRDEVEWAPPAGWEGPTAGANSFLS